MKTLAPTLIALCSLAGFLPASIPLPSEPNWTSSDNDYSTGGALADLDTNGYLDFCTSNGNDMANDQNGVYFNSTGTLETVASWRSQDRGMFGHCYAGDLNNDGLQDLAVGYLGPDTSRSKLVVRTYLNQGAGLNPAPNWRAVDRHSSFDCCLGDFDLDGDLDLAISSGDAYQGEIDSARVYRNNAGVLDTLPCWTASEGTASDAIRCADYDNDHDLDLFVGHRRKVSLFQNNQGVLDPSPVWQARLGLGWVLRLALGDYDNDGFLDLAVASNGQMVGDSSRIKVYRNNAGRFDTVATYTMLTSTDYSSCVAWGDVNGDGWLDLAAGGWWEPVVVFENNAGTIGSSPAWAWSPSNPSSLVCETVLWNDIDNSHLILAIITATGDGGRRLFGFGRLPIQFLDSVKVDGSPIPPSGYCFDPLVNWLSFASPPPAGTDNVTFYCRRSTHPDLVVTNWRPSEGNHLFLNIGGSALSSPAQLAGNQPLQACPNPSAGSVTIVWHTTLSPREIPPHRVAQGRNDRLDIYSQDGRRIRTLCASTAEDGALGVEWDGRDEAGRITPPGVYLAVLENAACAKLVRLR